MLCVTLQLPMSSRSGPYCRCVSHCSCRCRQEVGHIVAVCHIAVADVVKKWAIILSTYLPVFSRTCVCNICWPTKVGKVLLVVCHRHYNNFHTKSSPNNANITLIIQEHFSKSKNKTKTDVHSLEKIKGKTWQKNVFSDDAWRCRVSRGHLRMAMMHLHIKFGADICIQSGVIDNFPKFKTAAVAILDFQIMRIWPFRHVDSVAFVFCTKLG